MFINVKASDLEKFRQAIDLTSRYNPSLSRMTNEPSLTMIVYTDIASSPNLVKDLRDLGCEVKEQEEFNFGINKNDCCHVNS